MGEGSIRGVENKGNCLFGISEGERRKDGMQKEYEEYIKEKSRLGEYRRNNKLREGGIYSPPRELGDVVGNWRY